MRRRGTEKAVHIMASSAGQPIAVDFGGGGDVIRVCIRGVNETRQFASYSDSTRSKLNSCELNSRARLELELDSKC